MVVPLIGVGILKPETAKYFFKFLLQETQKAKACDLENFFSDMNTETLGAVSFISYVLNESLEQKSDLDKTERNFNSYPRFSYADLYVICGAKLFVAIACATAGINKDTVDPWLMLTALNFFYSAVLFDVWNKLYLRTRGMVRVRNGSRVGFTSMLEGLIATVDNPVFLSQISDWTFNRYLKVQPTS